MKILHVASFVGNIGDNASHKGLESILSTFFDKFHITRLEIRKFYKNYNLSDKKLFDLEFIRYANQFDMLIIGGGGFLDYWLEGSLTGTTIDIDPKLVPEITVPTLISSVGCMPHKAVPEGNIEKFRAFLDATIKHPKIKIAVRNDGSISSLANDIGKKYLEYIPEILDNGFFFETGARSHLCFKDDYVAINITNDQLLMNSKVRGNINKETYLKNLSSVVKYITQELKLKVVFVPHIYSDLKAINEILDRTHDFIVRDSISIAPYLQHDAGADTVFSVYKHSKLTIASRYHANVCSIAMGVPTIGLIALDRVKYVYDQLGMPNSYILLDYEFSSDLIRLIDNMLCNESEFLNLRMKSLKEESKKVYSSLFKELKLIN